MLLPFTKIYETGIIIILSVIELFRVILLKAGKIATLLAIGAFILFLFIDPETGRQAVQSGIVYFYSILIPSLLPMTFACIFIMKLSDGINSKSGHFGLFSLFFLSLTGGYIIGAKLIGQGLERGTLTEKQGGILSLFCVNGGLGFIIGAVGTGLYNSQLVGILLYLSNILYSLVGFFSFLPVLIKEDRGAPPKNEEGVSVLLCDSVFESVNALLKIGGFTLLFSAVNAYFSKAGLDVLAMFTEITTAVRTVRDLPLLSLLLGFGGISVIFQIISFLKNGISIRNIILSRIAHGLFSYGVMFIFVKVFPVVVPAVAKTERISLSLVWDKYTVSAFALVSVILLIFSLESKNRGGNLREDLLQ